MVRVRRCLTLLILAIAAAALLRALTLKVLISREPTVYDLPLAERIDAARGNLDSVSRGLQLYTHRHGTLPKSLMDLYGNQACADNPQSWLDPLAPRRDLVLFRRPRPLKYRTGDKTAVAYSVGPDELDDCGVLPYDPTNGLSSRGDISGVFVLP